MPQKINMVIQNGNAPFNAPKIAPNVAPKVALKAHSSSSSLSSGMVQRIHNVKPGCGSCGRHA
jgi:hypothetical protein